MSDLTSDCRPHCWEPVKCRTCEMRKAPRGRSVAVEAASGFCSYECPGYWSDPQPGHLWPNEAPPSGPRGGEAP